MIMAASGPSRAKESKDYRELSGMKPRKSKEDLENSLENDNVELDLGIDKERERELLGEELLNSLRDEIDDELLDYEDDELFENLNPDEILALAEKEEEQCAQLEREVKEKERLGAEARKKQKEVKARKEALKKLRLAHYRRKSLEKSLKETPVSSPKTTPVKEVKGKPASMPKHDVRRVTHKQGQEGKFQLPPPPGLNKRQAQGEWIDKIYDSDQYNEAIDLVKEVLSVIQNVVFNTKDVQGA